MAVAVCNRLTSEHLVAITRMTNDGSVPVAAVRPPPVGPAAHHLIQHLCSLHRHPRKTLGCRLNRQRVACFIGLFHLGEVHMERGPFVFLHPEIVGLAIGIDREPARQPRRWQGELCAAGAVGICRGTLFCHHLVVGVAQLEPHALALTHLLVLTVGYLIQQGRGKHLLPRAVDGTVGIDTSTVLQWLVLIETEVVTISQGRTGIILIRPGKHLLPATRFPGFKHILALGISHTLRLLEIGIGEIVLDAQMGASDGLTCCGTHHDIAHTLFGGLVLGDGIEIGDIIQMTDHIR